MALAVTMGFGGLAGTASAAGYSPTGQPGQFTFVDENLGDTTVSVNPGTGNLLVAANDLTEDPATYDVTLSRYYNSQSTETGALGPRWSWSVGPDVRITDTGSSLDVHGPTGFTASLLLQDDGTWAADAFDGYVVKSTTGYQWLRDEGDVYDFDSAGTLTGYTDDAGTAFTTQSTSAAGHTLLSSYGTPGGRRVNFSYNGSPRVIEADDPASNHRIYGYDTAQRLASYAGPSGTTGYTYDAAGLLSGLSRPDGTSATVTYAGTKVSKVQVTDPDGTTRGATYTYGAPTDAACDAATDIAQTTVTPLDGGAAVVYCSTPEGIIDNTNDPDDVAPAANISEWDADSPECAPGPDGYDARCSDPYGDESGADGPETDSGGVPAVAASFGVARARVAQARVYIDAHPWVTIRSAPKSFTVGNARGNWVFDRTAISASYDLGTVYGQFAGCGWVSQGAVGTSKKPSGRPHSSCSSTATRYDVKRFAGQINCSVKSEPGHHCSVGSTGFTLPAGTVECFNVGPITTTKGKTKSCGTKSDKTRNRILKEEHTHVSWRYVTRDKKYVLIRDSDATAEDGTPGNDNDGPWVFVKRGVLPANLCGHPNDHYVDTVTGHEAHLCHI